MLTVETFIDEVVRDLRSRLALLGDNGDRRAVEDGIALLTDERLRGMDDRGFDSLLTTLSAGRSPAGLAVLKPHAIARELSERWASYRSTPTIAPGS